MARQQGLFSVCMHVHGSHSAQSSVAYMPNCTYLHLVEGPDSFPLLIISVNLASNPAECEKKSGQTQTHTPNLQSMCLCTGMFAFTYS